MGPYCKGNMTSRIEGERNLSEISVSQSKNAYAFSFQIVFCNKFRLKNKLQDRERVLTYPNSGPTQVLSLVPTVSTAQRSSPGSCAVLWSCFSSLLQFGILLQSSLKLYNSGISESCQLAIVKDSSNWICCLPMSKLRVCVSGRCITGVMLFFPMHLIAHNAD